MLICGIIVNGAVIALQLERVISTQGRCALPPSPTPAALPSAASAKPQHWGCPQDSHTRSHTHKHMRICTLNTFPIHIQDCRRVRQCPQGLSVESFLLSFAASGVCFLFPQRVFDGSPVGTASKKKKKKCLTSIHTHCGYGLKVGQ